MADQSQYTATNLPIDGQTIDASDVNTDLQGLIDEFNKNVGTSKITDDSVTIDKLASSMFKTARNGNTNTAFGNAFATVESVALTLSVSSLVIVYGSCDGRVADTTPRSCRSKIVSTISAVDTDRSGVVTQLTSVISSGRTQFNAFAAMSLAAGSYTFKFQCINDTDATSVTTENSHIEVLAVPNAG